MKIVSFDPGVTTGVTIINVPDLSYSIPLNLKAKTLVEYTGEVKEFKDILWLFTKFEPDKVVLESFKLYPHKAKDKIFSSFPTVEVIGVIKYISQMRNLTVTEQGANTKKFYDNKKLRMCGVYKGLSPHERDAIRHAFYYVDSCKGG